MNLSPMMPCDLTEAIESTGTLTPLSICMATMARLSSFRRNCRTLPTVTPEIWMSAPSLTPEMLLNSAFRV